MHSNLLLIFLEFKIVHINETIRVVQFLTDCLFPLLLSYEYATLNGEKGWKTLLTLTEI